MPDGRGDILSDIVLSQTEDARGLRRRGAGDRGARPCRGAGRRDPRRAATRPATGWDDLDAVAVTAGPGLIGGLLVGLMSARAIAAARQLPLLPLNHLEGHALTATLTDGVAFPYLLLLVSGGHTQLLAVRRRRPLPAARHDHRRRAGRGLRQDREAARPALSRRAERRARGARGDPEPLRPAAPAEGRAGLRLLLLRAEDGAAAGGGGASRRSATADVADLCAVVPGARPPMSSRTARAARSRPSRRRSATPPNALVVAGGVAANADASARACSDLCARERHRLRRAAAEALHRQRRDDRLGRAPSGWPRGSSPTRTCRRAPAGRSTRRRRRRSAPARKGARA